MKFNLSSFVTALSTAIAAGTLGFALYQHNAKENSEKVSKWQQTLIYKIISERSATNFEAIKAHYITEAAQLTQFELPKEEIQDEALRYILLELQKDKLITVTSSKLYKPLVDGPNQQFAIMLDILKTDFDRKSAYYIQRPRILRLIESIEGPTSTELYQKVKDDKIDISEDDFYNVIFSLRIERFVMKDINQRLWATHDEEVK